MGTSMWRSICAVCPVVRTFSLDASRIDYHTFLYKEYTFVDKESCGESIRLFQKGIACLRIDILLGKCAALEVGPLR